MKPGILKCVLMLVCVCACGPAEEALRPESPARLAQRMEAANGLSLNGLSLNGLSLNGLSLNGLSLKGLSSTEFTAWFQTDPVLADMVMRYVVRCAASAGQSRTYTFNGQTYVWPGELGLAPIWANGFPILRTEQRVMSACLAAHANKYGLQIPISVQGRNSLGMDIPTTSSELTKFPEKEACFFGNLFTAEGIYVANDGRPLKSTESSARACALAKASEIDPQECAPILRVAQKCSDICTLDDSKRFYVSCTYNGVTYPALTTRMQSQDIYTCGDGICQPPERGNGPNSCATDCGSGYAGNNPNH